MQIKMLSVHSFSTWNSPKVKTKFKVNFVAREQGTFLLNSEIKSKQYLVRVKKKSTTNINHSNQSTGQICYIYVHICHLLLSKAISRNSLAFSHIGRQAIDSSYFMQLLVTSLAQKAVTDREKEQRNNFHSFCVFPAINQIPSDIASFMDYCKNTETMCNDNVVKLQK